MRRWLLGVFLACAACGGARAPASTTEPPKPGKPSPGPSSPTTTTTTTTVTKTTKVVPAPEPPDRPGDPLPSDPLVKHNLDLLNAYRKKHGAGPLVYDAKISAFALEASTQLAKDHTPHAYFKAKVKGALSDPEAMKGKSGFGSRAAENQGDWEGIPQLDPDPAKNGRMQVEVTLKLMYDEGPGGGHHDNMLNPAFKRVGIGFVRAGTKLYMTNDFSN